MACCNLTDSLLREIDRERERERERGVSTTFVIEQLFDSKNQRTDFVIEQLFDSKNQRTDSRMSVL